MTQLFSEDQIANATLALDTARRGEYLISTAESCTGGMIAGLLTDIAGSSDVVDCGFVTYSNKAKAKMLGVSQSSLDKFGAVSEEVANEMALGALRNSQAHFSVSVTGVAGPGGGSDDKPVGLVHICVGASAGIFPKIVAHEECRFGEIGRSEVRQATADKALKMLIKAMEDTL